MSWQKVWRLAKSDYLKMVPILALAYYMAFMPHLEYPYPIHIDEWVHLAYIEALTRAGSINHVEPFYGQHTIALSSSLEVGFHLFWSVFQSISGLSWLNIFRYFPGIIFIITVLSVYILAQREGFGWQAAFFTCLIPTTVGILGPGFLVPVAMGLIFVVLSLYIAFNFRTWWSYLVLFIFTCFLLSIHATTLVGLIVILSPFILLNLKGNFKHSLGLVLALSLPLLVLFPWVFSMMLNMAKDLFTPYIHPSYVQIPMIVRAYGYLPIFSALLGTLALVLKGGRSSYGLVLGLLAILGVLVTYYTFNYGFRPLYTRGLMYMMLILSVVAGAGLSGVQRLKLPERFSLKIRGFPAEKWLMPILCLALICFTLVQTIPYHQRIPYYHMIDKQDYEAFAWIRDNVGQEYKRAILDPWKATSFTAVTGKYVYTRIHMYPFDIDWEAYEYFQGGSANTTFLRENNISIVYTRIYERQNDSNITYASDNPDLVKVADNIYLLKQNEP